MEQPRITVYRARWCPDCRQSKQFLGGSASATTGGYRRRRGRPQPSPGAERRQADHPHHHIRRRFDLSGAIQRRIGGQIGHQPQGKTRILRLGDRWQRPRRAHHCPICRPRGDGDVSHREGRHGGQARVTECIDNYPGFAEGIGGSQLAEQMQAHAERFGVEILLAQTVTGIMTDGDYKMIATESGDEYCSNAVLLAHGTRYRRLGVPGEEDLIGAGIHFCALATVRSTRTGMWSWWAEEITGSKSGCS